MPQQTKTFRVFVSSTFTDMKLERGILQLDAFPRLEKFCEEKGAKFQAVDLRWGVNEEASLNQKTLQICFNEIARCQKISPKPNFLILLGEKYGWQPIPEMIPEIEMKAILGLLSGKDKELIEHWYRRDENAVPAEYVLQPRPKLESDESKRTEELKELEYKQWEPIEAQLREILRMSAGLLDFTPSQNIKYFASATHQEIMRGALNPENKDRRPEEHVFAFSRAIKGMPYDNSARNFIDIVNGNRDHESKEKLDQLKKELRAKLENGHFFEYTADWKGESIQVEKEELQKFSDTVYKKLETIIGEQIKNDTDKDELAHEIKLHEEFKVRLTEHFKGRTEILETIENYTKSLTEKNILAMIGATGTGKSSVMAEAVKRNEKRSIALVYRFIGTTSGSSNIMTLLQSLCLQIGNEYGVDATTFAREGDEKAWYDIYGLSEILNRCMNLATEKKPLLIFIDSLDQLSDTDNAKALNWLPHQQLPDNVHLIVSALPEMEKALGFTNKLPLPLLPEKDAIEILNQWLANEKRNLTSPQYDLVISKFNKTQLPLFLKLAFEKAKHWHSFDKAHTLKEDVPGIINEYFSDLEKEFPRDFVQTAISYMLSGRYMGLSENEILEILAFDEKYWEVFKAESHKDHQQELQEMKTTLDKEVNGQRGYMKIPIAVWSRLYLDLEPFLTERDADGIPIITFFHRQFNEVLRERYKLPDQNFKN